MLKARKKIDNLSYITIYPHNAIKNYNCIFVCMIPF